MTTPSDRAALEAEHAACYDDPIYDGGEPRHDWTWHLLPDGTCPLDRQSPLTAPTECCPHDAERHGPEAGGCIECRCRVVVKADRRSDDHAQDGER